MTELPAGFREEMEPHVRAEMDKLRGARVGKVRYPGKGANARISVRLADGSRREFRVDEFRLKNPEPLGLEKHVFKEQEYPFPYSMRDFLHSHMDPAWLKSMCNHHDIYIHSDRVVTTLIEIAMEQDGKDGPLHLLVRKIHTDVRSGRAFKRVRSNRLSRALHVVRDTVRDAMKHGATVDDIREILDEEVVRSVEDQ